MKTQILFALSAFVFVPMALAQPLPPPPNMPFPPNQPMPQPQQPQQAPLQNLPPPIITTQLGNNGPMATPKPTPVPLANFKSNLSGFDFSVVGSNAIEANLACDMSVVDKFPESLADDVTRQNAKGRGKLCRSFQTYVEDRKLKNGDTMKVIHEYTPRNLRLISDLGATEASSKGGNCLADQKKEVERMLNLPEPSQMLNETFKIRNITVNFIDNSESQIPDSAIQKNAPAISGETLVLPLTIYSDLSCNKFWANDLKSFLAKLNADLQVRRLLGDAKNTAPPSMTTPANNRSLSQAEAHDSKSMPEGLIDPGIAKPSADEKPATGTQ